MVAVNRTEFEFESNQLVHFRFDESFVELYSNSRPWLRFILNFLICSLLLFSPRDKCTFTEAPGDAALPAERRP